MQQPNRPPHRLLVHNARILTLEDGPVPRRANQMSELSIIPRGCVLCEDGVIVDVWDGPLDLQKTGNVDETVDANGRVVMPAFVDCHTHACFAGERLDEWTMKLRGVPYLDILKAGGGILSTVRAVRSSTQQQLTDLLVERLSSFLRQGTTTVEVKSGYGLRKDDELKMLRAIKEASARFAGTVVPTALLGHAMDADCPDFVAHTINETLQLVHEEFPGIAVDAFCEQNAWSLDDTVALLDKARLMGHFVRVHADQFTTLGMVDAAIKLGALSVDHLEASPPAVLQALADSNTIGVAVPGCGLHLDNRYLQARPLIDSGGAVAIATNFNPGSCPTMSMPLIAAMAVRKCGLNPNEAITACTVNAAACLGLFDRGRIVPGLRADLIVLRHLDERMLSFEMGDNPVEIVICNGHRL